MMIANGKILMGSGEAEAYLLPKMASRHGVVCGSTGSGKTITLKLIAENMAQLGVPVLLVDAKDDFGSLLKSGKMSPNLKSRIPSRLQNQFSNRGFGVRFWDVYGERGLPITVPICDMGSLLLSKLLMLNPVQSGVLDIAFRVSEVENLPLETLSDLNILLNYIDSRVENYRLKYGQISTSSLGTIQRGLTRLSSEGGEKLFRKSNFQISDWIAGRKDGEGLINILSADQLIQNPNMYATVLLWILTSLYHSSPEVGEAEKPRLCVIFDEAHLMFSNTSRLLMSKVETSVKLMRSKGISLWLASQAPNDIPAPILAQLNNRVLHSLRAYTPADMRGIRAAANAFRTNSVNDTVRAIGELKTGEALVSFLGADGSPAMVERCVMMPPQSSLEPLGEEKRQAHILKSAVRKKYVAQNWYKIFENERRVQT